VRTASGESDDSATYIGQHNRPSKISTHGRDVYAGCKTSRTNHHRRENPSSPISTFALTAEFSVWDFRHPDDPLKQDLARWEQPRNRHSSSRRRHLTKTPKQKDRGSTTQPDSHETVLTWITPRGDQRCKIPGRPHRAASPLAYVNGISGDSPRRLGKGVAIPWKVLIVCRREPFYKPRVTCLPNLQDVSTKKLR